MIPLPFWMVPLILLALTVAPARAASFDCAKAGTTVERAICADPALSDADSALAAAFSDALAADPHPQTVRSDQRTWVSQTRDKAAGHDALLAAYVARTKDLRQAVQDAAAMRRPIDPAALSQCIKLPGDQSGTCAVESSGRLENAPGAPLFYQVQTYKDGDSRAGGGIVVFSGEAGKITPLIWSGDDGEFFGEPALITTKAGVLLDLPGNIDGTGNLSAESLFLFRDGGWHEVDINSWLVDISGHVPKGLEVWKGVFPDWTKMTAETSLWREHDGNCCPTGGSAAFTLALRGDRIVIVSAKYSSRPLP